MTDSDDLIYAAFFFIDIVGLSNPILSTATQKRKIQVLNELIYDCKIFLKSSKDNLLILPTGDGMLIGFINGLEQPLQLAIELHEKLKNYNQHVIVTEKIETRIGCHVGLVFVVNDIHGKINLWGPGVIIARRIMDMGDANHILLSNEISMDILELSEKYKKILHLQQNFGIKHGENLLVYSAFGEEFGNKLPPKEKSKISLDLNDLEKNTSCEKMIFNIVLTDNDNLAKFERFYHLKNKSHEPISEIVIGVVTNSEEEFQSFDFKLFDENNTPVGFFKILALTPNTKKIVAKLPKPIFSGDTGRIIKMEYHMKLSKNSFENFFHTDTSNFELNFNHYSNIELIPKLSYFNKESGSKDILNESAKITRGMFTLHKWNIDQQVNLNDMIRLEW